MSYSFENKKYLRVEYQSATGKFGSSNKDTIILDGYRVRADIQRSVGFVMGSLSAKIYGLSTSDMNSMTITQYTENYMNTNKIIITAIDGTSETVVFRGDVINSWANYSNMPDIFLQVEAQNQFFNKSVAPPKKTCPNIVGADVWREKISIRDSVPIDAIMLIIAEKMCLNYENRSNIEINISNPYLNGSPLDQLTQLHDHFDLDFYIGDDVLAIVPKGEARIVTPQNSGEDKTPIISPFSGLIGYPTFNGYQLAMNVLFNPDIVFGGKIIVDTSIPQASGEWVVQSINHRLDSETPDGFWYSEILGTRTENAITK